MDQLKKYLVKYWKKFRNLPFISLIFNRAVRTIVLLTGGAYFLILDIRNEDPFVTEFDAKYPWLFAVILGVWVATQFLAEIDRVYIEKTENVYNSVLQETAVSFENALVAKTESYKRTAQKLSDGEDNIFDKIFRPNEQISFLISELQDKLHSVFDIDTDSIDVNIMGDSGVEGDWGWHFLSPSKSKRTDPKTLMTCVESTSELAARKGINVFYPEKDKLSAGEQYYKSQRDDVTPTGSIYCSPLTINVGDKTFSYVFTVNTYGKGLCKKDNCDSVDFVRTLFEQFRRRIELELTLNSIKIWREHC